MFKILRFAMMAVSFSAIIACSATPQSESAGQFLDSAAVTAKIKAKLLDSLGAKAFEIKVKTYKEDVQLSGFVGNSRVKERAGILAASVPNVKRIRNDLIVK